MVAVGSCSLFEEREKFVRDSKEHPDPFYVLQSSSKGNGIRAPCYTIMSKEPFDVKREVGGWQPGTTPPLVNI